MKRDEREKIDEVKEYWTDYYSVWSPLFEVMSQDDKIYVGDQWNFIETRDMRKRPKISINIVKKHTKPNPQRGISGGIVEKEMAIDVSNVMLYNPQSKKGDRVGFKILEDGRKVRVFKSTQEVVDV